MSSSYESPKRRAYEIWRSARRRAEEKGIEFTVPRALVEKLLERATHCGLLGIELSLTDGDRDTSPSLDRIDSTRGYTPDNVWIVSLRGNLVKSFGTPDEHRQVADGVERELARRRAPATPLFGDEL